MLKKFSKFEKFVIACACIFLIMIIAVFVLDTSGVWVGISDIFGFGHIVNLLNGADFLPTLLQIIYAVSGGYLFRKSVGKAMLIFLYACGGLIALLSLAEQIIDIIY